MCTTKNLFRVIEDKTIKNYQAVVPSTWMRDLPWT